MTDQSLRAATMEFVSAYYASDLAERESPESKWSLKWLENVRGEQVLSVGCGPTLFDDTQYFGKLPRRLVGVDINRNNFRFMLNGAHPELKRLRSRLASSRVKLELLEHDIRSKVESFHENFDCIYAMGILGMLTTSDLKGVLELMHSYLRPCGMLIDIDWTDCRLPPTKLHERQRFQWYSALGSNPTEVGVQMEEAGFKILKRGSYRVRNPDQYEWGRIYAFVCKKT